MKINKITYTNFKANFFTIEKWGKSYEKIDILHLENVDKLLIPEVLTP